jgi:molecular chaperone GrpE (heat shock protein)
MTNRPPPTLPKWIFIVADLLLLAVCAWTIQQVLPYRTTGAYIVVAVAIVAWMVGAYLCVWPWILEFKAQTQHLENETLASALAQIERLEEVGAKVQNATGNWQSAQDAAVRVVNAAREIEDKIKADSKDFMEFAERVSNDEKQHLKLEIEKLRRSEAEWLQVAARMLDHTFALTTAAQRSGQQNVATQTSNFQSAVRDAARRVGLIPFHPTIGEAFDERTQQVEDPNAKPEPGSIVTDILATGFTFQGQLLRRALVRVTKPEPGPELTEPVTETVAEETPVAEETSQVEPEATTSATEESIASEEPVSEVASTEIVRVEEEAGPSPQPSPAGGEGVVNGAVVSADAVVEVAATEPQTDEERPRRRQRKPDPQTSLPF